MNHDGLIDISIGKSRKEKRWQNKEIQWSALIDKLKNTHRTHESYSEYVNSKKDRQDAIKDIGGFVGGHISNGRRVNGAITHRTLVTLDIDFADQDFWQDWLMMFDKASCLYSTHKHSAQNPRYRLLLPLDRPVTAEEYEAIARRIASWMDIELFDPTTFQPTRLMYWPSTSKDGEYIFEVNDGPWFSADDILSSYSNWQDTTQWPYHAGLEDEMYEAKKQQGDPLTKPGLIGAMCRTYTIQEVIAKFLPDVYIANDSDDSRYSYTLGSTANGLVIYDDKFAYSHHATDPIGNKLCNAWDMVRLHKFGRLDDKVKEETAPQDLPSFKAMADMIKVDPGVRRQLGEERLAEAKDVFSDKDAGGADALSNIVVNDDGTIDVDTEAWLEFMEMDRNGKYLSTINNVVLILENDPGLKGCFAYDDFTNREVMLRDLPWRKYKPRFNQLINSDDSSLRHYLQYLYGITGKECINDGLTVVIKKNTFHPVREYIESTEWDGKKRIDTLFIDYLGAEDSVYMRAITRKTLIAAIARIFDPGCKFDTLPVLVGDEGQGKSTLIAKLGGQWYSDSFMGVQGTQAMEQLQGIWIMEVAELNGFKRADSESIKHFISKQTDIFRVAYGKRTDIFPRQGIFIASTNERNFLKDYTGNRRYWPVVTDMKHAVYNVFKDFTREIVNQVWAEAYLGYLKGEDLFLDKKVEATAKEIQAEHMELDSRTGIISAYLDTPVSEDWDSLGIYERRAWLQSDKDQMVAAGTKLRNQICVAEIYCELFNGNMREFSSYATRDLHNLMSQLKNWTRTKKQVTLHNYGRQFVYARVLDSQ